LCVKLFKLISTKVKKVLNCLCTKKGCKPVAELQREPEAILISDPMMRESMPPPRADQQILSTRNHLVAGPEHLHDFEG
jgi:hypothetical protein